MTQHLSGSASGHNLKFSLSPFSNTYRCWVDFTAYCVSRMKTFVQKRLALQCRVWNMYVGGFWCGSTHSPKCDLSLHCAAAAKRRDSTAFTISNIHWRRKRLLVRWLFISGTGSHQKKMLIVSRLTSYDWSYDVGLFFCLFFNDGLFPSCFILIGCMEEKKTTKR